MIHICAELNPSTVDLPFRSTDSSVSGKAALSFVCGVTGTGFLLGIQSWTSQTAPWAMPLKEILRSNVNYSCTVIQGWNLCFCLTDMSRPFCLSLKWLFGGFFFLGNYFYFVKKSSCKCKKNHIVAALGVLYNVADQFWLL